MHADQTASNLMVFPLPHGSLASVLFATLLVLTPLQPHATSEAIAVATAVEARKGVNYGLLFTSYQTILSQLQLRTKVPLDITHDHHACSPSHSFSMSIALQQPLYRAPQVGCNLYSVALCIQY